MLDVLKDILRRFGADTGTIHRLEGQVLILEAQVGLPLKIEQVVSRVPIGKGMAGLAAERNAPVSTCNIQTDTKAGVEAGARDTGVNGAIVVPIRDAGGQVRGTLGIGVHRTYEYAADETARLLDEGSRIAHSWRVAEPGVAS